MTTVAVDVGGTFTDVVAWDGTRPTVVKVSSTTDQSVAVIDGATTAVGSPPAEVLLHGTTVATNTLLERSGARVALITDPGFEDVIEIGRQHRPSLYDPFVDRPPPLVDRDLRFGVDDSSVARVAAGLADAVVVVARLQGYADPGRDRHTADRLVEAGISPDMVVPAAVVVPEFREFERTSTAVLTAYLRPAVARYLERLVRVAVPDVARRVLVMRSSGGLITPGEAAFNAASILLSGPAGGVVAAGELGKAMGYDRVISFDMGGTSTDVCRIEDGRPEVVYEREIDGYVCRLPSVAVHTVGAGGGSVGWVDSGGALRVGPRSAGAHPGPACYGRGGREATVTDANLLLGRLDPTGVLAGEVRLDVAAAERALARLGHDTGLDVVAAAEGMVEVVEANMERAVRKVSVEEGADPRAAVLVAFGGAGGLHATSLARRLEMQGVVIPPYAGVFSALGLLLSPPRQDRARSLLIGEEDDRRLDAALSELAAEAAEGLAEATGKRPARVETSVDVRYLGQSHETSVPYVPGEGWARLVDRFHRIHRRRNGFAREGDPVEVVTLRAAAVGTPALGWDGLPSHRPRGERRRGERRIVGRGRVLSAEVWWRPGMRPGEEVVGPAVIEDPDSTTYLAPGDRARLHPSGALEVEW